MKFGFHLGLPMTNPFTPTIIMSWFQKALGVCLLSTLKLSIANSTVWESEYLCEMSFLRISERKCGSIIFCCENHLMVCTPPFFEKDLCIINTWPHNFFLHNAGKFKFPCYATEHYFHSQFDWWNGKWQNLNHMHLPIPCPFFKGMEFVFKDMHGHSNPHSDKTSMHVRRPLPYNTHGRKVCKR